MFSYTEASSDDTRSARGSHELTAVVCRSVSQLGIKLIAIWVGSAVEVQRYQKLVVMIELNDFECIALKVFHASEGRVYKKLERERENKQTIRQSK